MAPVKAAFSPSDFPGEMLAAVAANAESDADRVHRFLHYLGISGLPENPLTLPRGFLVHLGAALRLLLWESQGVFVHREAGLPDAQQAICDAFELLDEPNADATSFCIAVMRLSVEHFASSTLAEIGADVAIEAADRDVLLDALADFLWKHSHA